MGPGESGVATADILAEHLDKKIRLFIFDKSTLSQSENFLRALKFNNVEVSPVPASYISAIQQLYLLLKKDDDLILVNPPLTVINGKTKIKKDITEYFSELKRLVNQKSKSDSIELLSKCVPIFPEANMLQIREKLILSLAEFGITGAFILKQQESLIGLSQAAQKEKKAELMAERFNEIRTYLIEHFSTNPDDAIKNIRVKMDEKELTRKKKESQKWMNQAEEYKKTKNYEEAINCYKKAIDAYPKDPAAYMESGKTYVRIQKYSRALERFKQASEISEDLPTPNQEIGNLRITQAREMIAKGANPENPQVKELLRDAIDNFQTAFSKASQLKPLDPYKDTAPDKEATAKIASDIFRLNLNADFGHGNDIVKKLSGLANESLKNSTGIDPEQLHPSQTISLGLGALDRGDYEEAEKLLFMAAKNRDYFSDATHEINYLGTRVRREKGEDEAIKLYNRLLTLNPPNKAAVYFNLSVAWNRKKQNANATAAIVKAIYIDPTLPLDNSFYQSPEIFEVLKNIIHAINEIEKNSSNITVPAETKIYYEIVEKFEELIHVNKGEAFKYLYQIVNSTPGFFKNSRTYVNTHLTNLMGLAYSKFSAIQRPDAQKFAKFLFAAINYGKKLSIPQNSVTCGNLLSQVMEILYTSADQAEAAYFLSQAIIIDPDFMKKPDFYASSTFVNLAKEIHKKLSSVKVEKLVISGETA